MRRLIQEKKIYKHTDIGHDSVIDGLTKVKQYILMENITSNIHKVQST